MLAFAISIPIAIFAGLAILFGGAFVGSQIDDKIENPIRPIYDSFEAQTPWFVKWPLIAGGVVFVVIVAKKLAKKVF